MASAENHLIEQLPRTDRRRLLALCEPVWLASADVLCERGATAQNVVFPIDASISMLAQIDEHPGLEVGMVGREGMLGAHLVLGQTTAPLRAVVQGPGAAWRIARLPFLNELASGAALQRGLHLYLGVLMEQQAVAVACQRFHPIRPRLARWLLMCQDRAHADGFQVTHEYLAAVLGVRRVGITMAAGWLQRRGLIVYQRGEVWVLDRAGLEAAACSCYAADRKSYDGLKA